MNAGIQAITLMGMSGVGKTGLCRRFDANRWFHYSVDYRIATRYLNEAIDVWLQRLAHQSSQPLSELLHAGVIGFKQKITIDNLRLMSAYIGKLGREGLPWEEFMRRQAEYLEGERRAMVEIPQWMARIGEIYGRDYLLIDATGSFCELDDFQDIVAELAKTSILVYLQADSDLQEELIRRTFSYPKPMCYRREFLEAQVKEFLSEHALEHADEMSSDEFIRFVFPRLIKARDERYRAVAERYGVVVSAKQAMQCRRGEDFLQHLINCGALACR